jgi:hypothetical protein
MPDDYRTITRELFALPLDEFTASRNRKAKELKAAGQTDLATQVAALRKPSLPLWAVNRVAGADGVLNLVRDAAEAAAKAQRGTSSADVRSTAQQFDRVLHEADQRAAAALQDAGHAASDDAIRRAREMIRAAALQGGDTWERLADGALAAEPEQADSLTMFAAAARHAAADAPPDQVDARFEARALQRKARDDARLAERALERAQRMRAEATALAERAAEADTRAHEAEEQAEHAREQAEESARAAGD